MFCFGGSDCSFDLILHCFIFMRCFALVRDGIARMET